MKFEEFGLSRQILKAVYEMGFEEPTPIQQQAIPYVLEGKDLIGQAQTGTGKTAAFVIPINQMCTSGKTPKVIVIEPTRELAIQVAEVFDKIGKHKKLASVPIFGGQAIDRQIRALKKGADIVIGTPGRLIDHIKRGTLDLKKIRVAVLDEADEMLDMGFIDDIKEILQNTPTERQTMLFSATIDRDVLRISKKYMREPVKIRVNVSDIVIPKIKQIFYEVRWDEKLNALSKIIDIEDPYRSLVFCHTKKDVDYVAIRLQQMGYNTDAIHGDYTQSQRNTVMKKFKNGDVDILIATDVAARGLDIKDVTHVINYSIPQNPESYIHRIGRTGRAGKSGIAITFITPKEYSQLRLIEKNARTKISQAKLPTSEEVMKAKQKAIIEDISMTIEEGNYKKFLPLARKILKTYEPEVGLAAALSIAFEDITEVANKEGRKHSPVSRLFMTTGIKDGISAKDIVKTIMSEAEVPYKMIGRIAVKDSFTFVEVSKEYAEKVIKSLDKFMLKGKKIRVEKAQKKQNK